MIGVAPAAEELLGFLTPFLINPTWIKGDGTQDLGLALSFDLATTVSETLDDEPFWTHLLKGVQVRASGKMYEQSKEIFIKILNDNWEKISPLLNMFPALPPMLLLKKF